MTIAVVLFADTFPVVITDTLLASPSDFVKAPVALPTIVRPVEADFEVQTPLGPMKISDLSQKIHPLGRRGMFAYSGKECFARSVANGISARLSKGAKLSEALVRSELYALTEAQRESIAFAIVYETEDGKRFQYHHRMQTYKSKVFGEVFFTGSGEKNLSELLAQLGSPQSHGISVPDEITDGREVFTYYLSALVLTSILTSLDFNAERKSLKAAHGAVYDVRMLSAVGLESPKVLYTFWDIKFRADGVAEIQLKCLMLAWRDGERLRIERAITYGEGASRLSIAGSLSYGIRPLIPANNDFSRDVSENRPWPRERIPYAVHYVEVTHAGGGVLKCQWPELLPAGKSSEIINLSFDDNSLPVAAHINGRRLLDGLADSLPDRT